MKGNKLLSFNSTDTQVKSALQKSLLDLNTRENIDTWAQTSLKANAENALSRIASVDNIRNTNGGPSNIGTGGFRAMFGLQLLIGYKVKFRATADFGYGQRWGNFGATSSLHFAAYNGGLGTGVNKNNLVVDITAALNLTVGGGQGTPLQSYSLNYNSPIPNKNNFKNSFSYGQLVTWNSNINKNKFSLANLQREGMIGFRLGDFNVSSNNDTKKLYFGDGGDRAWTGGISVSTPYMEVGFQDFSGDFIEHSPAKNELNKIKAQIKKIKEDSFLSKDQKKEKIALLNESIREITNNNLHTQTRYQKNLNKASTYFRINNNGYNATVDFIGDAWLQNAIHRAIKDFRFQYDHKTIETWLGRKF